MERAEQTMDRLTVEAMYKARNVAPSHIYELIGILLELHDQVPEIKAWLQERDNAVHCSEWMVPWLNEAAYTNSLGGNATLGVAAPHVLARNEQLCGLLLSSGWKQGDFDALPPPPGRMVSFRVSGAGTDFVNGLYTFDGLFGKGFQVSVSRAVQHAFVVPLYHRSDALVVQYCVYKMCEMLPSMLPSRRRVVLARPESCDSRVLSLCLTLLLSLSLSCSVCRRRISEVFKNGRWGHAHPLPVQTAKQQ